MSRTNTSPPMLRPGPLGRLGRILFGLGVGWYTLGFARGWITAFQDGPPALGQPAYTGVVQRGNLALYALALLAVYAFPHGTRPQRFLGAALLAGLAIFADYLLAGSWWGLPLALLLSLIVVVTFAYVGVLAHLVAGITANPG